MVWKAGGEECFLAINTEEWQKIDLPKGLEKLAGLSLSLATPLFSSPYWTAGHTSLWYTINWRVYFNLFHTLDERDDWWIHYWDDKMVVFRNNSWRVKERPNEEKRRFSKWVVGRWGAAFCMRINIKRRNKI
jgi:hypothetical protein